MNIDETTELRVAEIQPPLATKKPRALPHVWARFHTLKINEVFFVGADRAIKVNGFGFRRYARPACFVNDWGKQSRFEFITPWKRIKTNKLRYRTPFEREVAKTLAKHSPFVDLLKPGVFPRGLGNTVDFWRSAGHEGAIPPTDFSRDMDIERPPGAQSIQQTGPSA